MRIAVVWLLAALSLGGGSPVAAQTTTSERPRTGSRQSATERPEDPKAEPTRPTRPTAPATPAAEEEPTQSSVPRDPEIEREQKIREYYPPRPVLEKPDPILESLLNEIEEEVFDQLPLYGQKAFRQAVIDRSLQQQLGPQPIASPPPTYKVLPGDQVVVSFWNALVPPAQREATVQPDGTIGFDPIGVVQVAGMTVREFESFLTNLIRRKGPREATVRISFTQLHALRVGVRGEVRRVSSNVILAGYATVFDAITAVGGPTSVASLRHIKLYRGRQPVEVDLYRFLLDGDPAANLDLRDGDSIHVPVASRLVSIDGEVARPARYELTTEKSLAEAIALAGGLRGRAARLQLARVRDYEREALFDLSVSAAMSGEPAARAVEPLQHGDEIHVVKAGAAREVVTVTGAVGAEGDYGFRPGLTLGDVLQSAQGVLREGHVAVGTIRRAQPSGQVQSLNFEVAELLAGGPAAALPLQAGDQINIPRSSERAPLTVAIQGAVNEPGAYQMRTAHTLADLLQTAEGLAPGAAGYAMVLSTASGQAVETRVDLTPLARGGGPSPNPELANGDRVTVPFLSETGAAPQVRIEGYVRSPGSFTLAEGMRLGDLLQRAGGLLPRAATRGKLVRVVPGTNQTEVHYLDLIRAAAGDEQHNLLLAEDDLVQVDNAAALLAPLAPEVTIAGPVARPGRYPRHVGMRVSDLVVEAGGLQLEADRDQAWVERLTEQGRVQRIPIHPARAMAGDETADLELRDGDRLELVPWQEIRASRPQVRAVGALYHPSFFALTEGMTLGDLLFLAGGTTPEAYLPRAELHRRGEGGRSRVVPFDLTIKPLLIPLQDGDELRVYTHEQAIYREPTVEIKGEVQHPGRYERAEGMTLADLIFRAGGLTRNVNFMACEVARARDTRVVPIQPDLALLMQGDPAQNMELQDGDAVYVRTVGEYQHRPREVLVRGRVALPGFYPLSGTDDSLRQLVVERARGLLDGAFVEGTVLLRRVDEVVDPEVARYGTEVFKAIQIKRRRDDYALILSKGVTTPPTWLRESERRLPTETVPSELAEQLGEPADLTRAEQELDMLDRQRREPALSERSKGRAAGAAEALDDDDAPPEYQTPRVLQRYVRVAIDLRAILAGESDLRLRPNDILLIPEETQLILLQGEVASNMAQTYVPNRTVGDYVRQAGGLTRDAAEDNLLVVRANGSLTQAAMNTIVRPGDMILAPPKPLKIPVERRPLEAVQAIASILGGFATTLLAITQAFN
ncbi:MAG: SLBB domain-containing protein [Armatimonadetes bacterium]|nr:SLBB domain-containing protein [Armatimonadota bacterium]